MKKLLFCLIVLQVACAKPANYSPTSTALAPQSDPLLKTWAYGPGMPNWTLHLETAQLGMMSEIVWSYASGGSCHSMAVLIETFDASESQGTMTISNTIPLDSVSGMAPCSMFDGTWTWNLANAELTLSGVGANPVVFR